MSVLEHAVHTEVLHSCCALSLDGRNTCAVQMQCLSSLHIESRPMQESSGVHHGHMTVPTLPQPQEMAVCTLPLQAPVMAIAFAPEQSQTALDASYTFAVGLETGVISVWSISCSAPSAQADAKCVWESPVAYRHCASVMRLCWQQAAGESVSDRECAQKPVMHLASCGDDQCVRIFSVCIEDTSSESN